MGVCVAYLWNEVAKAFCARKVNTALALFLYYYVYLSLKNIYYKKFVLPFFDRSKQLFTKLSLPLYEIHNF